MNKNLQTIKEAFEFQRERWFKGPSGTPDSVSQAMSLADIQTAIESLEIDINRLKVSIELKDEVLTKNTEYIKYLEAELTRILLKRS